MYFSKAFMASAISGLKESTVTRHIVRCPRPKGKISRNNQHESGQKAGLHRLFAQDVFLFQELLYPLLDQLRVELERLARHDQSNGGPVRPLRAFDRGLI